MRDLSHKEKLYEPTLAQIADVLKDANLDRVGAMASVVAVLHENLDYFEWTGFYRVTQPRTLTIGPYQGHLACLTIPFNRGVCGKAARDLQTILVPDVREFSGYIACASSTLSEIVVPVIENGVVSAVLDVDSAELAAFDAVDQKYLEAAVELLKTYS